MVKVPFSVEEHNSGLIIQALNSITTAYKVGGYLLVAMVIGTLLMILSMMADEGVPRDVAAVVGGTLLVLSLLVILYLYVKPLRDLKRQLDEKVAFLQATEEGVVRMAETVRSFSDAIVVNNENTAKALKIVRPHLESFPAIANWVDGSENLSRELVERSMALRDAATSIENAFRNGDTEELRKSIRQSQKIAEQIKATASPRKLIGRINGEVAQTLESLKESEALTMLNSAMYVASAFLKEAKDSGKQEGAGSIVALATEALRSFGAANTKPSHSSGNSIE